jgi:hypothetical protein
MTEVREVIKYTPYLGELEPVSEVRVSEIRLYDNHIESIVDYDFEPYKPEPDEFPYRKYANLVLRNQLSIELTEAAHEKDTEKSCHPAIYLYTSDKVMSIIHLKTWKEAEKIYNKLKNWMIG